MRKISYLAMVFLLVLVFGLTACGSDDSAGVGASDKAAAGKKLYTSSCAGCHGPEAKGVRGIGNDLTTSEFVANQSDEELVSFIKQGRTPADPANTTGVAMPPKGGNPSLTDDELYNIVAYLRDIR